MARSRRDLLAAGSTLGVAALAGCSALTRTPEASGDAVRTDTVVVPDEWVFDPEVIEVAAGTTVTWRNEGAQKHTVTARDDEEASFDAVVDPGETTTHTFERTGTVDYYCRYHQPDMVGKVVVVE